MRPHFRLITFIAAFALLGNGLHAQEVYTSSGRSMNQVKKDRRKKESGFDPQRIIFGGGIGGGFDNYTASFSISPILGYKISDHFAAGIGLGYQYLRVKDFWAIPNNNTIPQSYDYYPLKSSIMSASVWGRYIIWRNIFAHVEYEHNFMSFNRYYQEFDYNQNTVVTRSENFKYNAPSVLVGGGLRQPIGERFAVTLMALYDVIQDDYSPYKGRIDYRIGFNVGF